MTTGSIIGLYSTANPTTMSVDVFSMCYNAAQQHVVYAFRNIDDNTVYSQFSIVEGTTLKNSGVSEQNTNPGGTTIDIIMKSENDNAIFLFLRSDGDVFLNEAKFGGVRYGVISGRQEVTTTGLTLGGLEVKNNYIYCQVEVAEQTWRSFYAEYVSGDSINPVTLFGDPIPGVAAKMVNTTSGNGYNIILNGNGYLEVWEGDSQNPAAGYTKVFTDVNQIDTTNITELDVIMFDATFAILIDGNPNIGNKVAFIDSNATRVDNYIGNAAHAALAGEEVEVLIGLPMINHSFKYNPGDIFYFGPYKYQAIAENKVLMIVEETVMKP
jgi:hypothetical protein